MPGVPQPCQAVPRRRREDHQTALEPADRRDAQVRHERLQAARPADAAARLGARPARHQRHRQVDGAQRALGQAEAQPGQAEGAARLARDPGLLPRLGAAEVLHAHARGRSARLHQGAAGHGLRALGGRPDGRRRAQGARRARLLGGDRCSARPHAPGRPRDPGALGRRAAALRHRLVGRARRRLLHVRRGLFLPRHQAAHDRDRAHPIARLRRRQAGRRRGQQVRHGRRARPGRPRLHVGHGLLPVRRAGRLRRGHQDCERAQRHQQLPRGLHPRGEHALPRRGAEFRRLGRRDGGPDRLGGRHGQVDAGHGRVPRHVQDAGEGRVALHAARRAGLLPRRRDDRAARRERLRQDDLHGDDGGRLRQEGRRLGRQERREPLARRAGRELQAAALRAAAAQVPGDGAGALREDHPERHHRPPLPPARAAPAADGGPREVVRQEPVGRRAAARRHHHLLGHPRHDLPLRRAVGRPRLRAAHHRGQGHPAVGGE
mmetsp:Transcript_4528/g.10275  ORF Transcript_4528/g.10275 Transcript_4528/m.10275 type:complete len:491 (+) Transcript_4528:254-1726(+)